MLGFPEKSQLCLGLKMMLLHCIQNMSGETVQVSHVKQVVLRFLECNRCHVDILIINANPNERYKSIIFLRNNSIKKMLLRVSKGN